MAENSKDSASFEKYKRQFMDAYYGEIAMVSDSIVYGRLRELRAFIDDVNIRVPEKVLTLQKDVLALSDACHVSTLSWQGER